MLSKVFRFGFALAKEPELVAITIKRLAALVLRRLQLHLVPAEDVAMVLSTHPIQFVTEDSRRIKRTFKVYTIKGIYLHKQTGLCMSQPDEGDWPSCIRESGIDDYQELSLRRLSILSATRIDQDKVLSLGFSRKCVFFHVGVGSGTNFFHFPH